MRSFRAPLLCCALALSAAERDSGYRGIWCFNEPLGSQYVYKYSGGFATYPQQHAPIAIYSEKARPSYLSRSLKPYSIDGFETRRAENFSYPQPWHLPGRGFLFLHTRYRWSPQTRSNTRMPLWTASPGGREWDEPRVLASIDMGGYQVSWPHGDRVGTAFDDHPSPAGLNARTNIYYAETRDFGHTWTTAGGRELALPLTTPNHPPLVRDFRSWKRLVDLKDVQYDEGRPVIPYLTSRGLRPGPEGAPRVFHTARWTGDPWEFRRALKADHNYGHGSLHVEPGAWRVIAPSGPDPRAYATGGEIGMWESRDRGATWLKTRAMTRASARNHTYVRRPLNAHPDFYALWADGHAFKPSESRIYFANAKGEVFLLPPG